MNTGIPVRNVVIDGRVVVDGATRWWACEHPEREVDDQTRWHAAGCHACKTVAVALARRGDARGDMLLTAMEKRPDLKCFCFGPRACACVVVFGANVERW